MTDPAYLTAAEAAHQGGFSAVSVRYWARRGLLPGAVKHGRDWLIPATALAGFVPPPRGRKLASRQALLTRRLAVLARERERLETELAAAVGAVEEGVED